MALRFVDPRTQPFVEPKSRGYLPHLYKPFGTYFITARLRDAVLALPKRMMLGVPLELDDPEPDELARDYDPPLTLGSCALGISGVAKMVQKSLLHFDQQRYELRGWCIMPNHLHIVFQACEGWQPDTILESLKGFTAREANKLLGQSGVFWESESFDHLLRRYESVERFVNYCEMNPVVAGLCGRVQEWPFSSNAWLRVRERVGPALGRPTRVQAWKPLAWKPTPQSLEACTTIARMLRNYLRRNSWQLHW